MKRVGFEDVECPASGAADVSVDTAKWPWSSHPTELRERFGGVKRHQSLNGGNPDFGLFVVQRGYKVGERDRVSDLSEGAEGVGLYQITGVSESFEQRYGCPVV